MQLNNIISQRTNKTIYRDGDLCIKLFNEDYSKSDVLNEALNQARVEETGLNIPTIIEVTKIDGKWAIVLEYIEGVTLDKLMNDNPDKLDEYLNQFVDLQLEMHAKRSPLLNKWKDKMNSKISATNIEATIRYELHIRTDAMPKSSCLCHGDFNPSNIIIGNDGKSYIIDWAHATQGNPESDAARTYLLFAMKDMNLAEKYIELFCKKSDTARQWIQKCLPIVAATQSLKGKPEEREFLMKWVDVVDFE